MLLALPAVGPLAALLSPLSARPSRAGRITAATVDAGALSALEQQGVAAAEAWDVAVTGFLDPELVEAASAAFEDRADLAYAKVGGYGAAARARLVFTNPELIDSLGTVVDLAAEHAVLLRVSAAYDKAGNKFGVAGTKLPNLLAGIGVEFEDLGDVMYEGGGGNQGDDVAYIVCAPGPTQKTIERLLPKSLGRSTIEVAEPGFQPEGATLVEMVVARLDKRSN
tara:strand:+ start:88 stop:759 length:672 start_codon:yes stop_codon:yes gene_type:complete